MKTPDIPNNENDRLATLRSLDILDTSAEERFDRLTRLAKKIFNVPIALVSIVDENRQWFKSRHGLDASETPRDVSFCGHTILGEDIFNIPDTKRDQRFSDNPLVLSEPNIRFYAGCPLKAPNGLKMGTLCIIDREPRTFDDSELEILSDLASMVERELAAIQLATLDELTNISNRRGFLLLGQHCINFCHRQSQPASLVYIDLDKFKEINDTFGHAEGDRVLTTFANLLKSALRNCDVFARLGGDEFAVLLTNASEKASHDIMSRLRQSLNEHNQQDRRDYDVNFSYGIVAFDPAVHSTIELLLADSDAEMYQRKKMRAR